MRNKNLRRSSIGHMPMATLRQCKAARKSFIEANYCEPPTIMHAALPGSSASPAMQDIMDRMNEVAFSFPDEITVVVEADARTGWVTATIL